MAGIVQHSEFCVDPEQFHFNIRVLVDTAQEPDLRISIGANHEPFGLPLEEIAVKFDTITGSYTGQAPGVLTSGFPPPPPGQDPLYKDRWEDGRIVDGLLANRGLGVWDFSGSIAHGADAFVEGDSIFGVGLSTLEAEWLSFPKPVTSCLEGDLDFLFEDVGGND